MGGSSSNSSSSSTTTKKYGTTTTSNPYITSTTNNKGTTTTWAPNTAMETASNFVNANIGDLYKQYLNPTLDSTTNQAKLNAFNKQQQQNLENNIISPLANRNMIRSSQATDMYNNLSNQASDYANSLLASSQADTGNIINNLMNAYLQGWNVINGNQALSLNSSQGNGTQTTNSNSSTKAFSS